MEPSPAFSTVRPPITQRLLPAVRRVILAVAVVALLGLVVGWTVLRSSLPQLDGRCPVPGLTASVQVERDHQGVPTVVAADESDAVRALGFLHAQERFFQMDLIRRKSAGTLAELLGPAALNADREVRRHGFRALARKVWDNLGAEDRARLATYTAGVNAGLQALGAKPWEYHVLRTAPLPWSETDCLLVSYTMWLDLQDEQGRFERTVQTVRANAGEEAARILAPMGDTHDAPLDGSLPPATGLPPTAVRPAPGEGGAMTPAEPVIGSNAFAVAGRHTASGSAMLASDMHLGLTVPNVWYRAVLRYPDRAGTPRRIVGVTLPGVPSVSAGSNGRIAWGFTNAYVDTVDVVPVEVDETGRRYRTESGWVSFEERAEVITVKGGAEAVENCLWTRWGPVVEGPKQGRAVAIRWTAHDPAALNLAIIGLLRADNVNEALGIAHAAGMANQNLILADSAGHIAWTVAGRLPVRSAGFDGLHAGRWDTGESRWTGWLPASEVPVILDPPEGLLWSANQRHVGGEMLRRLGDNGYDHGYRAGAIRDGLRELAGQHQAIKPGDLLGIQLDDRMRHLLPWRGLLVDLLQATTDPVKVQIREQARGWSGRAEPDSAGYRLVREFREQARERVLAPFLAPMRQAYRRFNADKLHSEAMVWRLLQERPEERLDARFPTWGALFEEAIDAVVAETAKTGRPPSEFRWGDANRLDMRHPLGRALPRFLTRRLDMPPTELPGDADSPRNQTPRHGASERLVVSPGHEEEGLFEMPGGQSGHPLSPYYRAGHLSWVRGEPTPLLPGPTRHVLQLIPR